MSRKIVFIFGSPRENGNTRVLMERAMKAAREAGATVEEINAVKLKHTVPGCSGCLWCKKAGEFRCVIGDEVARQVGRLPEYDTIVFATPVYWLSYSAQIKIFIDRMYCLVQFLEDGIKSPLSGKTLALISSGGGTLEGNLEVLEEQFLSTTKIIGAHYTGLLLPLAPVDPGAIADDGEAMRKAAEFGRSLALE
ncbi:MAG: flavodoxin family protein [PVC group bacterium]